MTISAEETTQTAAEFAEYRSKAQVSQSARVKRDLRIGAHKFARRVQIDAMRAEIREQRIVDEMMGVL